MSAELKELAQVLRGKYGAKLRQIILFGSRARGGATPESDYDFLLIFKELTPSLQKELDRLAAEWLLERGMVFSWVALSERDLEYFRYEPFIQNARREGISV